MGLIFLILFSLMLVVLVTGGILHDSSRDTVIDCDLCGHSFNPVSAQDGKLSGICDHCRSTYSIPKN